MEAQNLSVLNVVDLIISGRDKEVELILEELTKRRNGNKKVRKAATVY